MAVNKEVTIFGKFITQNAKCETPIGLEVKVTRIGKF